jgi:CelD/BcsL family acetyltransferase involved in cellulose biosynthesis
MGNALMAFESGLARMRRSPPGLDLRDLADRTAFAAMEGEWNTLVEASSPEPFYRHEYIRSFLDNFVPNAPLKVVTGRDAGGRLVAGLPLVAGRGSICGIGVRELASPTNVHSLRFDLVAEDGEQTAEALFEHLAADPGWDVLRITDVPQGGKAWQIYEAAQAAGYPVGAWESQRSPYVQLPSSYEDLLPSLHRKFKANLRRRRKRLAEQGEISVERLAGRELSERQLDECLALERSGWKGGQGSAVSQSEATHGFHLELFRTPVFRDHLSLFLLKLGGQPIAFHYGLTSHGVYSLVLTSYDERFKEFSPGHLLTEEVLEDCISRGLREFDFLGCDLPWKLDWTSDVRPHHWLYVFRDSLLGRSLWQLKFGWVRSARRRLSRWISRLSPRRASPRRFA